MEPSPDYRVQLPLFEGPLDLLLHLIKKNDLDINDIPMAVVLGQYLEYLQLARELNIDLAGEFLEMAAELTYIKSKLLLPEPPVEAEEGPDPRADLVAKLLEYQRYKSAASLLISRPMLGRDVFRRPPATGETPEEESWVAVDTLKLLSVFQDLLKRIPEVRGHEVRGDRLGVTEKILELMERLQGKERLLFEALFAGDRTRGEVVVTFLAMLEMARQRLIRVVQEQVGGPIVVVPLFSQETAQREEMQ